MLFFLLFCFVCVRDILVLVLILRLAFRLSSHYLNGNYYYYYYYYCSCYYYLP